MPATEKLTDSQIQEELKSLSGWELKDDTILKLYKFDEFLEGIHLINRVAGLAEKHDHHPDIDIRYTKVTLHLSTHSAGGLTLKDFQLAREIDAT